MDKDIIVAEDEDVKIIFHFKVFCELERVHVYIWKYYHRECTTTG